MEVDRESESNRSAEEVEFAQTVARYNEVLSKIKLLRTRLLLTTANITESQNPKHDVATESKSVLESFNKMEEEVHRLSTQEEMLKHVKASRLALEYISKEDPNEVIDTLLKEHCANQSTLFDLSKAIRHQQLLHIQAMKNLMDNLCKYTASLQSDKIKLAQNSSPERNQELEKMLQCKIKEIRFMQICIPQIVSTQGLDLRDDPGLQQIVAAARNPITSFKNFH